MVSQGKWCVINVTTERVRRAFRPMEGVIPYRDMADNISLKNVIRPNLQARILDCCRRSGWTVTELSKSLAVPESSILTILRVCEGEGQLRVSSEGVWTIVKTRRP